MKQLNAMIRYAQIFSFAALFFLLNNQTLVAQGQWEFLHPETTVYHIKAVHFNDASTGWAMAWRGPTVLKTNDGGESWSSQQLPVSGEKNGIYFVDDQHGWIIGDDGLLLNTKDGGDSWTQAESPTSEHLYDIHFIDASVGWLVGDEASVFATYDGGSTWIEAIDLETMGEIDFNDLLSLHVHSDSSIHAAGVGGTLIYTDDGGQNWSVIEPGTELSIVDLQFVGASTGWLLTSEGVFGSNDGGASWTNLHTFSNGGNQTFHFADENTGFVCAEEGKIYATTDGGQNWTEQNPAVDEFTDVNDIYFIDVNTGWAVGETMIEFGGTIQKTTNGGSDWTMLSQTTMPHYLNDVFFNDANTGWICGSDNFVASTNDGGDSWASQNIEDDGVLTDIQFVDEMNGWVVGEKLQNDQEKGVIYVSSDGGANWTLQLESPDYESFESVFFLNASLGWVVGQNAIFHTGDGGASWNQQTNGFSEDYNINDIYFTDELNGIAVGYEFVEDKAAVLTTADGGQNWEPQLIDEDARLFSVHFSDASNGWIVGNEGMLLNTEDGGETWQIMDHPADWPLYTVHFTSEETGWIGGRVGSYDDDCELWSTTDGGETWNCELRYLNTIESVHFMNENNGFIVGIDGLVLRKTTGSTGFVDSGNVPSHNYLHQNHPNPANDITTIPYNLPGTANSAQINIFDLRGRMLQSFELENIPGKGELKLNLESLPAGAAFYSLFLNGELIETKKLLIK